MRYRYGTDDKRASYTRLARRVIDQPFYGWLGRAFKYRRPLQWPSILDPIKAVETAYSKLCSPEPAVKRLAYYLRANRMAAVGSLAHKSINRRWKMTVPARGDG